MFSCVIVFVSWLCSIIVGKWKLLSMNQKGHIANTVTQFKVKLISQLVHQISTHNNKKKSTRTISYQNIWNPSRDSEEELSFFFQINTKENSVYVVLDSKNRYVVPAIQFKYSSFVSCIVDIIFLSSCFFFFLKWHTRQRFICFFMCGHINFRLWDNCSLHANDMCECVRWKSCKINVKLFW